MKETWSKCTFNFLKQFLHFLLTPFTMDINLEKTILHKKQTNQKPVKHKYRFNFNKYFN